jgi:outer membrane receptor protein involved in Fe transport
MALRLTLAAAALAAAFPVWAQEKTETKKPPPPAPTSTVEVKGSASQLDPRRDDTASKIVVHQDEILKFGDTSLLDAMKRMPGLTVSGGSPRMRGLSGYTQILVNGERPPPGFSLDSVNPDQVERVEIIRTASVEFSTASVAGTINIIMKRAVGKPVRNVRFGVQGDPRTRSADANINLQDKIGDMAYGFNASIRGRENESVSEGSERQVDGAGVLLASRRSANFNEADGRILNVGGNLHWSLGNGETFSIQGFGARNVNEGSGGSQISTVGGRMPFSSSTSNVRDGRFAFGGGNINWISRYAGEARLEIKANLHFSDSDSAFSSKGFALNGAQNYEQQSDTNGNQFDFNTSGKFSKPIFEGHAFAFGWSAGASDSENTTLQRFPLGLDGRPMAAQDNVYTADVRRLALYAQDEWNITKRFSVYFGGRWETVRTHVDTGRNGKIDASTSVFSPVLQTLWKLPDTKADQLRFALTRTYRPPNTGSLIDRRTYSTNNSPTSPDSMGNPKLKPELATGIDITLERFLEKGGTLSASISNRRISNFTRPGLLFEDGRWIFTSINRGKAHTWGIEADARFPLKSVWASAPAIDVRGSISRHWSRVDSIPGPDNRLDNQTPFSASFGLDYKFGDWTAGTSFQYSTGGWVRRSERESGYTRISRELEMFALYRFTPQRSLRIAGSNLLAPDMVSGSRFVDSNLEVDTRSVSRRFAGWRVLFEQKF